MKIKCPNCGSEFEATNSQESEKCKNCGAIICVVKDNSIDILIKRGFIFLEDGEWEIADEFYERILNIEPECAYAYLGKLMIKYRVKKQEQLRDIAQSFEADGNYLKAVRFGDEKLKHELQGYVEHINIRNEKERLENIINKETELKEELYQKATGLLKCAKTAKGYQEASANFALLSGYKDSDDRLNEANALQINAKNI